MYWGQKNNTLVRTDFHILEIVLGSLGVTQEAGACFVTRLTSKIVVVVVILAYLSGVAHRQHWNQKWCETRNSNDDAIGWCHRKLPKFHRQHIFCSARMTKHTWRKRRNSSVLVYYWIYSADPLFDWLWVHKLVNESANKKQSESPQNRISSPKSKRPLMK